MTPGMRGLLEIARDILREAGEDRITGEAAKAAYYFALSLFPAILALFALTGILGGHQAFQWIMGQVRGAMPGQAADYLGKFVAEITGSSRPGILSLSIVLTLWSASTVFAALTDALNVMFDLEEERSWWRRRLLALLTLVASLAALAAGAAGLLAGPGLVDRLGLPAVWTVLRYPAIFALITAMMLLIYVVLPHRRDAMVLSRTVVGAVVGASLWVLATLGFRLYVAEFGSFSRTYGAVGALMLLLIWLYLTALAILFGGEVAATLEQRAHRKPRGEAGGAAEGRASAARCESQEGEREVAMTAITMTFGDLATTAREQGFEVTDLNGLTVNEEMQSALEDEGVWNEVAHIDLREVPRDAERAVVADVAVGDQRYLVVGDGRNAEGLSELLRGTNRSPYNP